MSELAPAPCFTVSCIVRRRRNEPGLRVWAVKVIATFQQKTYDKVKTFGTDCFVECVCIQILTLRDPPPNSKLQKAWDNHCQGGGHSHRG